jgi:glutamyl-tRNA reductase
VRRFVDISVPRNIAPGINAEQHGGIVYNVDDLKEVVVANKEARAAAAAEAEVLLRCVLLPFTIGKQHSRCVCT